MYKYFEKYRIILDEAGCRDGWLRVGLNFRVQKPRYWLHYVPYMNIAFYGIVDIIQPTTLYLSYLLPTLPIISLGLQEIPLIVLCVNNVH